MIHPTIKATIATDVPGLITVLDETGLFPSDLLTDMLAPFLEGDTGAVWLTSYNDNHVVGFCYTIPEELADGTWNMLALAVRPDFQGRGIGAALVTAAEQHLRAGGHRILIVDTSGSEDFARTRKFYAQNGYEEEARIRDFWAVGDDKVIFRKAL